LPRHLLADFLRIAQAIRPHEFVGANTPIFMAFRVRKSPAEIERIRRVCSIASAAYASLPERRAIGDSEIGACRKPAATRSAPAQFTSLRTKLTG